MTTAAGRGVEERALRISLFTYFFIFISVLGLGFAIWTGSNAILLDGVFNVVSFIIGLIAIRVARLQSVAASPDFHFGHGHFEPLLNTVRMLMILALAAFALGKAVVALFHGGVPVQAGFGIIYGAIASASCVSIGLLLRSMSKRCLSPLVEVDAKTWLLNAAVSLAAGRVPLRLPDGGDGMVAPGPLCRSRAGDRHAGGHDPGSHLQPAREHPRGALAGARPRRPGGRLAPRARGARLAPDPRGHPAHGQGRAHLLPDGAPCPA